MCRVRQISVLVSALLLVCGCKEDPQVPPEKPRAPEPEIPLDVTRFAKFNADIEIVAPNLVFVLETDAVAPNWTYVTLTSAQPGPDDARVLFYSQERTKPLSEMKDSPIDFSSGSSLDLGGNGFFSKSFAYQPKLATLAITDFDEGQVRGKITGEFYKFRLGFPAAGPSVLNGEATFNATIIRRGSKPPAVTQPS
ncbi:MAG: hypothetical protein KF841_00870 [Phycisphaerae bacterium]|nr:hypothetical protein [Phycisphaerae bacterium]